MRFDKRVQIQARTESTDAYGHVTPAWSESAWRWANIADTGGRELVRAQKLDATIDAVITLRNTATLTAQDRVIWGTRTFNIKAVIGGDDRTPRRGQILHCTEYIDDTNGET